MTDSRLARESADVVLAVTGVASRLARLSLTVLIENLNTAALRPTPGTRHRRAGRTYSGG